MFNKGGYVGHLEPTIEDIKEREKIHTFKQIQMPKQCIVLLPNEWWQNKSNWTLLGHLIINWNNTLKQNLKHY